MSDPIPTTIPRSTLACPPAKNFTDQYVKPAASQGMPQKSSAPTTKANNSDKDSKGTKETVPKMDNFTPSGAQFRSSSKDIKQPSVKNINKEPLSGKKDAKAAHS